MAKKNTFVGVSCMSIEPIIRKICPLMSKATEPEKIGQPDNTWPVYCYEEGCAWWNKGWECCIIHGLCDIENIRA